uniref:Putative ovule protein n=1 Tax=Solanum chacoense TaxID=4108 RepID=A0A0V0HW40_SOLCH
MPRKASTVKIVDSLAKTGKLTINMFIGIKLKGTNGCVFFVPFPFGDLIYLVAGCCSCTSSLFCNTEQMAGIQIGNTFWSRRAPGCNYCGISISKQLES